MLHILSSTTFGSHYIYKEIRAQVVDDMAVNGERFSAGQNDFEDIWYFCEITKNGVGNQEFLEFSELYSVNVHLYDMVTSSNYMHHFHQKLTRHRQ